jgi:hypothetical protein
VFKLRPVRRAGLCCVMALRVRARGCFSCSTLGDTSLHVRVRYAHGGGR